MNYKLSNNHTLSSLERQKPSSLTILPHSLMMPVVYPCPWCWTPQRRIFRETPTGIHSSSYLNRAAISRESRVLVLKQLAQVRREAEAQDWGFRAPSFHSTSRNRTLPISPDRTYRVIISSNLFSILPMEEQWRTRGLRYVGTQNFVKCIYQSLHLMGLRHWYGYGCWESKLYLGAFSAGLLTTSMLL